MNALSVEFLLLVVCAACGFGAVSELLVMPVGMAGLLMSSLPKYLLFWRRATAVDRLGAVKMSIAISVLNAFVAVAAAYGLGLTMRILAPGL